jgi:DNA primase
VYQHKPPGASVFEVVREEIPIDRLIDANGHRKISCIAEAHEDSNPSMHVYDDHVHCFGCGFRGDVVDVWGVQRGIERPIEAALDLAREFGVQLPEMSEASRQKTEEKRQKQGHALKLAQACHRALENHPRVREWWEGRCFGEELRERFLLGTNRDGTQAVIPFWGRGGRVLFLVRRKLEGEPKYILPSEEELPDGHKPLFIPGPIRGGELYLVEGYVDALVLAALGKSVVAIGGTGISDPQRNELSRLLPKGRQGYILPDDDESGRAAGRTLGRMLFPKAKVCSPSYGEGNDDIADLFAAVGPKETTDQLGRLVLSSRDALDIETDLVADIEGDAREKLAYATEHIVPLLARITPAGLQDANADIVCEKVKGLKKSWLNKAIKDHNDRMLAELLEKAERQALAEMERQRQEYQERVGQAQKDIDSLLAPGVLERLRSTAARMHNVYGDREPLELALLVALGAQLEPLPNGRPLGASILLSAEAGRGKNHIVDAAVKPLPPEFYFAFEIASGQSLYYKADEDPEFLKHTFAYPNEIEGAEQLWEFLRPMLSKGKATKIVTAKDADGNMVSRTIIVEGPVTVAIPTIRNKTDEQLQTRLLVAELEDYAGRVKEHSHAVSEQLLPDAASADFSRQQWLWQEGLRQLTAHRRVVFPLRHPDFAYDDDQVSHGARLWANLLSLMATHAWLEQKNRCLLELAEEKVAIEATPDDYEAAYRIFTKVCKRTVVNLGDTHRKILGALYDLEQEFPNREGFPQREISKAAKVSQSMVSDNKTFLVMSAKLIKETDHGLILVEGAHPSWWATGDMMKGLPTPEQVRVWWEGGGGDPPPGEKFGHPPKSADQADQADQGADQAHKPHTYGGNGDRRPADQLPINDRSGDQRSEGVDQGPDHDQQAIGNEPISENGIGKPNAGDREEVIGAIGMIGGSGGSGEESTDVTDELIDPSAAKSPNGLVLIGVEKKRYKELRKQKISDEEARKTILQERTFSQRWGEYGLEFEESPGNDWGWDAQVKRWVFDPAGVLPRTSGASKSSSVEAGETQNGRRLTEEEVLRVRQLVREGMSPRWARAAVLKEDPQGGG